MLGGWLDFVAALVFATTWLGYEPILKRLGRGSHINTDMTVLRRAWMRMMAQRDNRFIDGQLMGHALNSASFFASSNLILIAAVSGVLFGGGAAWKGVQGFAVVPPTSRLLLELKLALVLATLARGLLDFIWSIRQMNYCLAVIGAAPAEPDSEFSAAYGAAAADLLNPALSNFNAGVRGYYFALSAAAWLVGPLPFLVATLGAFGLLVWRQRGSGAAVALRALRDLLERGEG